MVAGWIKRVPMQHTHLALGPGTLWEIFICNTAYARPGITSIAMELYPPLEHIGDRSSPKALTDFLTSCLFETENEFYLNGDYSLLSGPDEIVNDHDIQDVTKPCFIVQIDFEVPVTPGQFIAPGLRAHTIACLLYFKGKDIVIMKANNFEPHEKLLKYETVRDSIRFNENEELYNGPKNQDQSLEALNNMLNGFMNEMDKKNARTHQIDDRWISMIIVWCVFPQNEKMERILCNVLLVGKCIIVPGSVKRKIGSVISSIVLERSSSCITARRRIVILTVRLRH